MDDFSKGESESEEFGLKEEKQRWVRAPVVLHQG